MDIRSGDGPDSIQSHLGARRRHVVDGGRGDDVLALFAPRSRFDHSSRWLVDVPREKILVDGRKALVYRAVEGLGLSGSGGRLTFLGGPGRDGLSVPRAMRLEAFGGPGRDTLTGGRLADRLVGGPGRDLLIGNDGRDHCLEGERLRSCEVRR